MAEDAYNALVSGTACVSNALARFIGAYGSLPIRTDAVTHDESTLATPDGLDIDKMYRAANCAVVGLLDARTCLGTALHELSADYQELRCPLSTRIQAEKYDGSNRSLWRDFRLLVEVAINSEWPGYASPGQLKYFLCTIFAGDVRSYFFTLSVANDTIITSATDAMRVVTPVLDAIERIYNEHKYSARIRFERAYNAMSQGNASFQSFLADFIMNAHGSGRLTALPDSANPNPCLLGDLRHKTRKELQVAVDTANVGITSDWDKYVNGCLRLDSLIKAPRSRQSRY